ncbi:MAG: hypothetical protein K2L51_00295 [Clostridiales bacterium]|nr:hypothetical protein [Clostridiales bacterium]
MKFTKKICGNGKAVWDAPRKEGEFLRITQNLSGQYVLYHCYGLDGNGITPLRSDIVARADTLRDCKKAAQEKYEPKEIKTLTTTKTTPDYSHVRMPYKD